MTKKKKKLNSDGQQIRQYQKIKANNDLSFQIIEHTTYI